MGILNAGLADFAASAALWVSSSILIILCVNGFVQKVLDRQIDRVARFAVGFVVIILGIWLGQNNNIGDKLNFIDNAEALRVGVKVVIYLGMLTCIQALLDDTRKAYWSVAIGLTVIAALLAGVVYYYI